MALRHSLKYYLVKFVLPFLKINPIITILLFFAGLTASLLSLYIPILIGSRLDKEFGMRRSAFFEYDIFSWTNMYFVIGLLLVKFILDFSYNYKHRLQGEELIQNIKMTLFEHQLNISNAYFEKYGYDKFLLRYASDLTSIRVFYTKATLTFVIDSIVILLGLLILFLINVKTSVFLVVFISITLFINSFYNKQIVVHAKERRNALSRQLGYINRSFRWLTSLIIYNQLSTRFSGFIKKLKEIYLPTKKYLMWDSIRKSTNYISQFIALIIISMTYKYGWINLSEIIVFILVFQTIQPIITRLLNITTIVNSAKISFEKLDRIYSIPIRKEIEYTDEIQFKNPRLEIENFSKNNSDPFSFRTKKEDVNHMQLPSSISFLQFMNIVTTLDKHYDGSVFINKLEIKNYNCSLLTKYIGVISAELPFTGKNLQSVLNNTLVKYQEKELLNSFNELCTYFNLNNLESIYDKRLTNNNLYKEILAIQRGIIHQPKIIFIDKLESLKREHEEKLNEYFKELKTTIIFVNW